MKIIWIFKIYKKRLSSILKHNQQLLEVNMTETQIHSLMKILNFEIVVHLVTKSSKDKNDRVTKVSNGLMPQ
jgi:hypothetical protein